MLEQYSEDELAEIAAQLLIEAILEGRLDSTPAELSHAREVGLELGLTYDDLKSATGKARRFANKQRPREIRLKAAKRFVVDRRKTAFAKGANRALDKGADAVHSVVGKAKGAFQSIKNLPHIAKAGYGVAAIGAGIGVYNHFRKKKNNS